MRRKRKLGGKIQKAARAKGNPDCAMACGRVSVNGPLCECCESVFYYWRRKSPTEMIHRVQKLHLYERRMEAMLGNVGVLDTPMAVKRSKRKKS